jgi:hypothetical protein
MRYLHVLLIGALLLMGSECEPQPPKPQGYCSGMEGVVSSVVKGVQGFWNVIIGGFPAEDRYSTVYVGIVGVGSCSGIVLNEHTVLTAGHCNGPDGYHIYPDRTGNPGERYVSTGHLIHPGYTRWENNRGEPHDDLMLIYFDNVELPGPFPLGFYGSESSEICERTFGQGWGQTERPDAPPPEGYDPIPCAGDLSRCLQEASIKVLDENPTDIDTQLVSALNWGNICFGDSGGPLYAQLAGQPGLHLAGVTSTISAANCVGYDGNRAHSTHVKVWPYKDWITQNTH